MTIEILENCWKPERGPTPTILEKGQIVDLPDAEAKQLIESGKAAKFAPAKEEKAKKEEPEAK